MGLVEVIVHLIYAFIFSDNALRCFLYWCTYYQLWSECFKLKVLSLILIGAREAVAVHRVHAQIIDAIGEYEHDVYYIYGQEGYDDFYPEKTRVAYLELNKRAATKSYKFKYFFETLKLKKTLKKFIGPLNNESVKEIEMVLRWVVIN